MNYEFLTLFIGLSIINVVFSTIRSIITINGGKLAASLFSAGYFSFYNIMMIYTVMDFPLWQKCVITFVCNFIGVYLVKWGEEKSRKDKLWKIEATFWHDEAIIRDLKEWAKVHDIGYKYNDIVKYYEIDFYSNTQKESALIRDFIQAHHGKYFVAESKNLD